MRILPPASEPFVPARRTPLSGKQRAALADSQGNLCAACGGFLGAFEADHDIPLWISGKDEGHVALCIPCHRKKTAERDQPVISHIKRILARVNGTRRERKKIAGRGFDRDLVRGMDGKVRER